MSRAWRVLATGVTALAITAVPGAAWARFSGTASGSLTASTHTLGAPTNVTTLDCGNGKPRRYITVNWTPSSDPFVTGYTVTMVGDNGQTLTGTAQGGTAATTTVDAIHSVTYAVTVAATYLNWTSAPAAAPGRAVC